MLHLIEIEDGRYINLDGYDTIKIGKVAEWKSEGEHYFYFEIEVGVYVDTQFGSRRLDTDGHMISGASKHTVSRKRNNVTAKLHRIENLTLHPHGNTKTE